MTNIKDTSGYDFTNANENKIFVEGKCDEIIRKLVKDLEWENEFN
jgi:hypothetical protein